MKWSPRIVSLHSDRCTLYMCYPAAGVPFAVLKMKHLWLMQPSHLLEVLLLSAHSGRGRGSHRQHSAPHRLINTMDERNEWIPSAAMLSLGGSASTRCIYPLPSDPAFKGTFRSPLRQPIDVHQSFRGSDESFSDHSTTLRNLLLSFSPFALHIEATTCDLGWSSSRYQQQFTFLFFINRTDCLKNQ